MKLPNRARNRNIIRLSIYAFSSMIIVSGFNASAWAAQKDQGDMRSEIAIMQALLLEVRELRQSVEHLAVVNARMQITMQQLQLQAQRLSQASAKVDDIRKQIATVSSQQAEVTGMLQSLETQIGEQHDEARRRALEQRQSNLKAMVDQFPTKQAALRAQEADAATVAQDEQNKWQDLSDQLSALTQSLGSSSAVRPSSDAKVP